MFGLSRDLINTVNSSPVIQFSSTDTSSIIGVNLCYLGSIQNSKTLDF